MKPVIFELWSSLGLPISVLDRTLILGLQFLIMSKTGSERLEIPILGVVLQVILNPLLYRVHWAFCDQL